MPGDSSTLTRRQAGDTSTLSMREKAQLKRQTMREHNSNFRAGYISIDESYLTRTGIRGRKRYFLYCFVAILIIVSVLNAVALGWLVYAFCITHLGMASMEFVIPSHLLRVWAESELPDMILAGGLLGSRHHTSLSLTGRDAALVLQGIGNLNETNSRVMVSENHVNITADSFLVVNGQTGQVVFSPDTLASLGREATNLHADAVEVQRVSSRDGISDLSVESFNKVKVFGAEGVSVETKGQITVFQIGTGNIYLNASTGQLLLSGRKLYLSTRLLQQPPPVSTGAPPPTSAGTPPPTSTGTPPPTSTGTPPPTSTGTPPLAYKLCVCRHSGRVFSAPVISPGYGCANASVDFNPCGL